MSVKSPVTSEGVITRATPFPDDTFTVTSGRLVPVMPPVRIPVLSVIEHWVALKLAEKLPLL